MKLESSQEALEPTTDTVDDQKHLDASLHLFTPALKFPSVPNSSEPRGGERTPA